MYSILGLPKPLACYIQAIFSSSFQDYKGNSLLYINYVYQFLILPFQVYDIYTRIKCVMFNNYCINIRVSLLVVS